MNADWLHNAEESAVVHGCISVKYPITCPHTFQQVCMTYCGSIFLCPYQSISWWSVWGGNTGSTGLWSTLPNLWALAIWLANLPPVSLWLLRSSHLGSCEKQWILLHLTGGSEAFGVVIKMFLAEQWRSANWLCSQWAGSIWLFGNWQQGQSKWHYSLPTSCKADTEIRKRGRV